MAGGVEVSSSEHEYDHKMRIEMLKAFDETKAGVKGLADSGVIKIPRIFIRPSEELAEESTQSKANVQIPVIDLSDILNPGRRTEIVKQVMIASETLGFFQVVNHGIPSSVLDGMTEGIRIFNEQDLEEKKKFYTRDETRNVKYHSNCNLYGSRTARWRDTLTASFLDPDQDLYDELPLCCRDLIMEYSKQAYVLGDLLLGLLSEGLGLRTGHLKDMECLKERRLHCHYYPACPEPELSIGTIKHTDAGFLTILLQNQTISGLQLLYDGQWIDIHPIQGGLVIVIGDLLQLLSNGRFKSNVHRATTNQIGPRISVACFFSGPTNQAKVYGPIQELISDENPPVYRESTFDDYVKKFLTTGLDHGLDYYRL